MKKFLTILFFFIFLFLTGGITEKVCSLDDGETELLSRTSTGQAYSDGDYFHNYMAATEANTCPQSQQNVNVSRVKRAFSSQVSGFLKLLARSLSLRDSVLAQHTERLYNSIGNYFGKTSCEYYVFALRRIII